MVGGRRTQISQLCRAVLTEFSKLWNGLFSHALFKQCILAMIVIIIGKNNGGFLQTILTPQNHFYEKLAKDCVENGVAVDLFLFPNAYIDVATIGSVATLTGGQIYRYSYFKVKKLDGTYFDFSIQ